MAQPDPDARAIDFIAAPGWSAVYMRDAREFAWPLVAWFRADREPSMVGLALSLDGRGVVRADQIEGFRRYQPPAEWLAEPESSRP